MEQTRTFGCSVCGEEHDGPPLVYDTDAPAYWYGLPPEEREERAELTSDRYVIDGRHFFPRGNLKNPILDPQEKLVWGVWVCVSELPYFGRIDTALPGYPETVSIKSRLRTRPVGLRPLVELPPTEHPLSREQQDGISPGRVREIAGIVLHPQS